MYNFYNTILNRPQQYRQLRCRENLITLFNCPLENNFEDAWSHHNYIVYVIEGRKIWHTAHGSYDLQKGSCVFVRKGGCIVEQFFDSPFCLVLFFVPDEFVYNVLKTKTFPILKPGRKYEPVIPISNDASVQSFFQSMLPYFESARESDPSLLELKFKELVLTIADNPDNSELLSYFCSLLQEPQTVTLQRVMEDNFCYNLKLEEFARLSNRSLSAFKRDFQKHFSSTPGKWIMEKRLSHAMHLLSHAGRSVGEASFESGFENPAHFSRAFRNQFGVSPASVKKQIAI
ncbi:AraC family transcriptional regulator [Agriterribacter sp.]|uniref:helix-turn-helix domain-containing protein n=1 Tax=Agriterribacter sp. TaxID=2821509 RepID=UPI002B7AA7F8|nr:AraC family transcriptional regulator [Agriterribacter sp.]HTN06623.1 AraC family transcriptional regulator [Agriterribacter sp.]